MGFKSFKSVEEDRIDSLPNAISVARGVGGVVVGSLMSFHGIDATTATNVGIGLGLSDMEGSAITLTARFPRLQRALHIFPTKAGRAIDAAMDKVFAISFIAGATIAGYEPRWQASGILTTELATAGVAVYKKRQGADPQTSKVGTVGMVVRCSSVAFNMFIPAYAEGNQLATEILSKSANVASVGAIALGAASCYLLSKTSAPQSPELLPGESIS